jgi:Cactus-binding C-terminus of cactin protein
MHDAPNSVGALLGAQAAHTSCGVLQEWEYSHKKGFKSTFERGILHLYFNFKRARYRR